MQQVFSSAHIRRGRKSFQTHDHQHLTVIRMPHLDFGDTDCDERWLQEPCSRVVSRPWATTMTCKLPGPFKALVSCHPYRSKPHRPRKSFLHGMYGHKYRS
eukprot:229897-Chlamydomonas_euryale.AAC.4